MQVTLGGGSSSFPLLSETRITVSHLFYEQDGEVSHGVEVGSYMYWLLCSLALDVTAVYIKADVEEILCLSLILFLTPPALNEVDDIAGLTVGCSSYMEGLASGGTNKINVSPERMRW